MKSELERTFETYWRQLGGVELEDELRFCQTRKWRFDFASPTAKVAIELEGGTWSNGRHTRPAGFTEDCEKYNWAALNGWRVFRITSDMLKNAPIKHLTPIIEFINGKTDSH